MAEFENKALGVKFSVPDIITVRQRLDYTTAIILSPDDDNFIARAWYGVRRLVKDWECAAIPDPLTFDIDASSSNDAAANVILWTVNTVIGHLSPGGAPVPKNS